MSEEDKLVDISDDIIVSKVIDNVNKLKNRRIMTPGMNIVNNGKSIKITQEMIETAYNKLKMIVSGEKITTINIGIIVMYALQIANEMLVTNKNYKVELAIAILRKLIDSEIPDLEERKILNQLVEFTIPTLIDTISGLPNILSRIWSKCKCTCKCKCCCSIDATIPPVSV